MHIKTSADTTTIAVSICPICGTIEKSGKMSCCGRGGSWFKRCGGAGHTKLHHTWHEGIRACKRARSQSKAVIVQQLNVDKGKGIDSSQDADIANYATPNTFVFTPDNTSAPMSDITSIVTSTYTPDNVSITTPSRASITNTSTNTAMVSSTHTSVSTRGCVNLLEFIIHINFLFIIVFY